jgi:hypothetical protein
MKLSVAQKNFYNSSIFLDTSYVLSTLRGVFLRLYPSFLALPDPCRWKWVYTLPAPRRRVRILWNARVCYFRLWSFLCHLFHSFYYYTGGKFVERVSRCPTNNFHRGSEMGVRSKKDCLQRSHIFWPPRSWRADMFVYWIGASARGREWRTSWRGEHGGGCSTLLYSRNKLQVDKFYITISHSMLLYTNQIQNFTLPLVRVCTSCDFSCVLHRNQDRISSPSFLQLLQ